MSSIFCIICMKFATFAWKKWQYDEFYSINQLILAVKKIIFLLLVEHQTHQIPYLNPKNQGISRTWVLFIKFKDLFRALKNYLEIKDFQGLQGPAGTLYLCENHKTNHFTQIWERFTGNFDLCLVNILNIVFLSAIMLFLTNHKAQNLTALV